ncbi:IS1634 family transposase [Nostoc punctiforme UO1]|uniref:IS1634 family transposase n=1 Tax=Nostoc punctiforme TaxID=272131 RepID=UPI003095CCC5
MKNVKSDLRSLSEKIEQSLTLKKKSLKRLENKKFACEADALGAAKDFEKHLKYHQLNRLEVLATPHYKPPGKPRPGEEITHYTYQIHASLVKNEAIIKTHQLQAGRFILATNLLDEKKWTQELILQEYKAQQTTERGFRFIKDPLFFASRVFLKSTKRIMSLAMIMTLALMVYSFGQLQLRQALKNADATLLNQKGKPTAQPTLRWIFQCFQSVHLVFVDGIKSSIKLTDRQKLVLQFFASSSHQYYFLS